MGRRAETSLGEQEEERMVEVVEEEGVRGRAEQMRGD